MDDIVALERRNGDEGHVADGELAGEGRIVVDDLVIDILIVVDQIHLVDCHKYMGDLEQRRQEAMPLGLGDDAVARVDEDDGQFSG